MGIRTKSASGSRHSVLSVSRVTPGRDALLWALLLVEGVAIDAVVVSLLLEEGREGRVLVIEGVVIVAVNNGGGLVDCTNVVPVVDCYSYTIIR